MNLLLTEIIQKRISEIEADSRYQSGMKRPALVEINAPLALVQSNFEGEMRALKWTQAQLAKLQSLDDEKLRKQVEIIVDTIRDIDSHQQFSISYKDACNLVLSLLNPVIQAKIVQAKQEVRKEIVKKIKQEIKASYLPGGKMDWQQLLAQLEEKDEKNK